ncbi:MAG: dUTP diphosphatase [Syntrophomonadaceae bacterium]|nr:dUTP diphosphatase [Syntrophomonadaceae bacterium]
MRKGRGCGLEFNVRVDIKKVSARIGNDIPAPYYATAGAAGMDLCACLDEEVTVEPGERIQVPTGIAIKMPRHVVGLIFPRSGHAWRSGIILSNAVGVVDADYVGEVKVLLTNLDREKPFTVRPGDRIAQIVFMPVLTAELNFVDELEGTLRGAGGFGSTGW